ncbi:ABC transporter substrate-binding protein [Paenibacillus piri]|uniref:ABC transporter substrate-binding protein n=1 Tax=Paenibacillus piri TaxID=2547395 RepID=A0A4R5KGI0_9BACL|nr:ABC transporter substrate-binding protein [Paenibacillus piri]TDF93798.1 ABC transporter substrate-binding protein [Paenibacillus piri]
MSKWLTKFSGIVLCISLIAGCSSGAATNSTSAISKEEQATSVVPTDGNLLPNKPTEVIFWHSMTGTAAQKIEQTAKQYNETVGKEKGITIAPIFQGAYDEAATKLAAILQSDSQKDLPDIMQLSSKGIFDVKNSKYIVPVQDFVKQDAKGINLDDLNQNAMQYAMYNNKMLGLPFSNSSIMMYYNKDHFKEAGLDPNSPPKTVEELAKAVKALSVTKDNKITRYGIGIQLRFFLLGTWIPMQGQNKYIFNNEDGHLDTPTKISMTTDGTLQTLLTEWKKVLDTGGVEYTDASPMKGFQSGLYSIMPASTSSMGNVKQNIIDAGLFDVGVAELPRVNKDSTNGTGIGGSAVYLFDRNNKDSLLGAWDYLKYLATPEISADWFMSTGYYPMNSHAMELEKTKQFLEKNPHYKIIQTIADHSKNYTKYLEPWVPSFTDMDKIIQDEIIRYSNGSQDMQKTISNIEASSNQLLQDWHNANP